MLKYDTYKDFPNEGVNFIDLTKMYTDKDRLSHLVSRILLELSEYKDVSEASYIIAPESRGFILGSILASKLGIGFVPVRKKGKLPKDACIVSTEYNTEYSKETLVFPKSVCYKDKSFIFVDDVLATGGTYRAVESTVETLGGKISHSIFLYDVGLQPFSEYKANSIVHIVDNFLEEKKSKLSWDKTYMEVALVMAKRSKDINTKVGACIVGADNVILSTGYNGAPRRFNDDLVPTSNDKRVENWLNTKYPYVCHAELNALLNYRGDFSNFNGATAYVTMFPCNECAKALSQAGISEIVYLEDKHPEEDTYKASKMILKECGIVVRQLELEKD